MNKIYARARKISLNEEHSLTVNRISSYRILWISLEIASKNL